MTLREWPPRLYLAVDCGGTKSAAAICDESGTIVGRGQGGPSNYTDNGLEAFLTSVEKAVRNAIYDMQDHWQDGNFEIHGGNRASTSKLTDLSGQAISTIAREDSSSKEALPVGELLAKVSQDYAREGAPSLKFEAAWLGIAGVDSATDVATLSPHVGQMLGIPYPSARLVVANDTSLLASPIADSFRNEIKSGVVVIAGTGSIVMSFRRRRNGMLKVLGRIGGFGWLLGDEGSGYAVGRNAIRKVLDVADRERLSIPRQSSLSEEESDSDDDFFYHEENSRLRQDKAKALSPTFGRKSSDNLHIFRLDESGEIQNDQRTPHAKNDVDKISSIRKPSALPPSPPPSAGVAEGSTTVNRLPREGERRPYGHALRDRILQHWGLSSTDELLRAVYLDEGDSSKASKGDVMMSLQSGMPSCKGSKTTATQETNLEADASNLSRSDHTVRDSAMALPRNGLSAEQSSLLSLPEATSSAKLLPPSAGSLEAETYYPASSPIPSLSSSPASSSTAPSDVGSSRASNTSLSNTGSLSPESQCIRATKETQILQPVNGLSQSIQFQELSSIDDGSFIRAGSQEDNTLEAHLPSTNQGKRRMQRSSTLQRRRSAKAERKHRLASLAPVVFHLAFSHDDPLSLDILRAQAQAIALQIHDILQPGKHTSAHLAAESSVLCLGGSLVGVKRYRDLLVDELLRLGVKFAHVEYVGDAARRGAEALSHVVEEQRSKNAT